MKEEFETAKLIIVKFDLADIITTSNGEDNWLDDDNFEIEL